MMTRNQNTDRRTGRCCAGDELCTNPQMQLSNQHKCAKRKGIVHVLCGDQNTKTDQTTCFKCMMKRKCVMKKKCASKSIPPRKVTTLTKSSNKNRIKSTRSTRSTQITKLTPSTPSCTSHNSTHHNDAPIQTPCVQLFPTISGGSTHQRSSSQQKIQMTDCTTVEAEEGEEEHDDTTGGQDVNEPSINTTKYINLQSTAVYGRYEPVIDVTSPSFCPKPTKFKVYEDELGRLSSQPTPSISSLTI